MAGRIYEVMNPWADVDPIPQRGLGERLNTLECKKIELPAYWDKLVAKSINIVPSYLRY